MRKVKGQQFSLVFETLDEMKIHSEISPPQECQAYYLGTDSVIRDACNNDVYFKLSRRLCVFNEVISYIVSHLTRGKNITHTLYCGNTKLERFLAVVK